MSVTVISDRVRRPRPPASPPASAHRASPPASAHRAGSITVTVTIALDGDPLPGAAVRLLDALQELAGELGGAVRLEGPRRPVSRSRPEETPGRDTPTRPAARVRPPATGQPTATDDGVLYLYPDTRVVARDGARIRLTRLEFDLLLFLCEHPGQAFHRAELLRGVWGYDQGGGRTVDVHIRRLRAKTGAHRPLVTTVHGVGYRLDARARVSVVHEA